MTTAKFSDKIKVFIKNYSLKNYAINIYDHTPREKGILNFSKQFNANLIGISAHNRKGITHFFNESIREKLVNHAKRLIITLKI